MVIVEPLGGLGNRMRVILSGMILARERKTFCVVIWQCNEALNAPFQKLFKTMKNVIVINISSLHDKRRKLALKLAKMKVTDDAIRDNRNGWELEEEFEKEIKLPVYFYTCEAFKDVRSSYKTFQPTRMIQERIESVKKSFGSDMVGVHIRRTIKHFQLKLVRLKIL